MTQDNWPQWLKDADTENAVVDIVNGRVFWRGGVWHGGDDNPTRCMFTVRGSRDTIKVGCKNYTIAEAKALCEGGELPLEAPARESDNGKLLRSAVLAQIAWQEALNLQEQAQ